MISLRAKGIVVVAGPAVATVLSAALFFLAKSQSDEATHWVTHTLEVEQQTGTLLVLLTETETGMRGYLPTHNPVSLENHDAAANQLPRALARLQLLVSDNPLQTKRLRETIVPLISQRLQSESDSREAFHKHGLNKELQVVLADGDRRMKALRAGVREFLQEEGRLLGLRQERDATLKLRTEWTIFVAVPLGLGLGVVAILLFTNGIVARVERIVAETEAIQRGETPPDRVMTGDEIGRLGSASRAAGMLLGERQVELQAKEKAEAASVAKSQFLANMTHEIRTPLNGIIGLTNLTLETELSSTQRDYLDMVKHSSDSLVALVSDILDLAKIKAGRLVLEVAPFDLYKPVERCSHLASRAPEKGLTLRHEIAPDVPQFVAGDALRLRQVLINLSDNAIKFTDEGEIRIRVAICELPGAEIGLQFSVSDNGIGVPPEKQQLIFEAFTQADSSTTRQYGGTGLGLTICSQLVAFMGGRIWLESTPGSDDGTFWSRRSPAMSRGGDG